MKKLFEKLLGGRARAREGLETTAADQAQKPKPSVPPGRRLYCIGDIHGRLDLLQELHEMIREDAADYQGDRILIYMGDYIDRGAQSREVLDLLIEQPLDGFEPIYLKGNHEQAMQDFLLHPEAAVAWLDFGGQVTLMSYGVGLGRIHLRQQVNILADELDQKMPQTHHEFLSSCRLSHQEGNYAFVHAGVRPRIPFEQQSPEDLMWIRDDFIRSQADHGYVIVHGHTISEDVDWQDNRIGIDTGAYNSGLLTALVLEGDGQRLLQTGRPASV